MDTPLKYKTMVGHSLDLIFAVACLKSFIDYSEQEIHLQIFEDGT